MRDFLLVSIIWLYKSTASGALAVTTRSLLDFHPLGTSGIHIDDLLIVAEISAVSLHCIQAVIQPIFVKSRKNMPVRNSAAKKKQRAPSIAEARVYRALKKAITSGQFSPGAVLVQE